MDISRRQFLLGTAGAAAGLILPGYYRRALEFIDRSGRPLLEAADRPRIELTAFPGDWDGMRYKLAVGDPFGGPPPMSLGQFCERYGNICLDHLFFEEEDDEFEPDWDALVDWDRELFYDAWMYRDAPEKLAYELLCDLDLGPALGGPNAVGELHLEAGSTMVSSYWDVDAADDITLSLLQQRLNDLGQGVRIKVA